MYLNDNYIEKLHTEVFNFHETHWYYVEVFCMKPWEKLLQAIIVSVILTDFNCNWSGLHYRPLKSNWKLLSMDLKRAHIGTGR